MKLISQFLFCITTALIISISNLQAQQVEDFGFLQGFSIAKMDLNTDPRKDFPRYAAGLWRDAAKIPSDNVRISSMDLMSQRLDVQLSEMLHNAAKASQSATKGSPLQQVGTIFADGLNEAHLKDLGVDPILPEFDRIDSIDDAKDFARAVARYSILTNDCVILGLGVMPDINDRNRYALFAGDAALGLPNPEDYSSPESGAIRDAYLKSIADNLIIAGDSKAKAKNTATKIFAIETRIAALRQNPVDQADPNKRFVRMSYSELKALSPTFEWNTYLSELGVAEPKELLVVEIPAMRERGVLFQELSLEDQKLYLRWEVLRRTSAYLTPEFDAPKLALSQAIYGDALRLPVRTKQVANEMTNKIGQPISRLYVDKQFSADAKIKVEEIVDHVRAQFHQRLRNNKWLTKQTRALALAKLEKIKITVGYPDRWIDYSPVDIRPNDYFGNMLRISEFLFKRNLAKLGTAVVDDTFNDPRATLPIIINAAYEPSRNAIEIPAAFLQAPLFDPSADAAVNFCAVGSVIGHELTHGFDSQGRLYDADGNVRNWWLKADELKFNTQTEKLVRQANAFQVLPGLHANGALAVGENLADVGGIAFAYSALNEYLKKHPKENQKIDGLTPQQRCFISWGQVWADKTSEGFLRLVTATDPHPPGEYRAAAPSQHEAGFYKAFGIRPGDPMWLAPADRVSIW